MTNAHNDYLSLAASELEMHRAALSCLLACFGGHSGDAESLRAENVLYLLEGGLDRIGSLLEQEAKYRMSRGKQ
ncbi:hypothetical protein [Serratia liquefaciens]|uniref:hypothetical protein n=1 Tax=Serratia liquefaciens TaxID=614 RepID=UPI003906BEC5